MAKRYYTDTAEELKHEYVDQTKACAWSSGLAWSVATVSAVLTLSLLLVSLVYGPTKDGAAKILLVLPFLFGQFLFLGTSKKAGQRAVEVEESLIRRF